MKKRTIITGHVLATTLGCLIALGMASCFMNRAQAATSDANSPDWIRIAAPDQAPAEKPALVPFVTQQEVLNPPPARANEVRLFIDQRTGCHWFVVGGFGQAPAISPRLYSDGVQVCD